jgi:hypothetical protein
VTEPACTHPDGWSERGMPDDRWVECWLCGEQRDACPGCGKPAQSFACKIRHVGVTIGWGRAQEER